MRPDEWKKGMENEAASVEDTGWARETRRCAYSQKLLARVLPLAVICLSVLTFPSILAMTEGDFRHPWPLLMGLCATWLSLLMRRNANRHRLERLGWTVMGLVGVIFALAFAIQLEGTAAILWLLGFPLGACLACLGSQGPDRLPLGLLTLPLGVWLLMSFIPLPLLELQDTLLNVALALAQAGWLWLGLLLLRPRLAT